MFNGVTLPVDATANGTSASEILPVLAWLPNSLQKHHCRVLCFCVDADIPDKPFRWALSMVSVVIADVMAGCALLLAFGTGPTA